MKTLVDLHGGMVALHSDGPGSGSTFTVRLPLAQPPVATLSTPGSWSPHAPRVRGC